MDSAPKNLQDGCLLTLRYFGIFSYPLTLEEIHRFNRYRATLEETRHALSQLIKEETVFQAGPFFLPVNKMEWVEFRTKGNERAFRLLAKSGRYAAIIASFPFVRGIAISGSLSKFYASETPDIDYFIITDANRLWIARTWLHLFKKATFITGHQHFFCMNYFVDATALKITHPNLYTAVEVATLMPVYNAPVIKHFFDENEWIRDYLPNHPGMNHFDYLIDSRKHRVKKILEWTMGLFFPGKVNIALMRLTDRKWRRKWRRLGYPEADYDQAFLTNEHISKNHPVDYEKKVLRKLSLYQDVQQQGV